MDKLTRMDLFMKSFDVAIQDNMEYLIVLVRINDKMEIIINVNDNFVNKRDYYNFAYNDDLELAINNDVSIINYMFATDFNDLMTKLSNIMEVMK